MKRLVQIVLVAALAFAAPVHAVRRYSCNFETQAMRDRWTLNPVSKPSILNQIANRWYIGEPGNNDRNGNYGLYISDDGGLTAHYQNKACWVMAYDTIALDHLPSGDYTIYFDYCAMANVNSNFDGIYLLWLPESVNVLSIPTSSGTIPSQYENYVIELQPMANMDYLNGTSTWLQCAATIPNSECDGTKHSLVFVWTNGTFLAQQPGAMIDNINISDNKPCPAPTDLVITPNGTTISVEWQGTTTEYEVSAYSYDGNMWLGPKIVTGTQTNFTGVPIGQTDFIVRAKCDEDFYSLKTIKSELIYYPDQMCVDYLNLNNAVCYIAETPSSADLRTFNSFTRVSGPVDYGPSNIESRHVVHFDRNELESRTGNMAKTVPDGELASVRLGNWKNGNGAERIEFTFDVDTIKYPVLLLKYLPILEAPGHGPDADPRFKLDIVLEDNTVVTCGKADFNCNDVYKNGQLLPGAAGQGWHITPAHEGFSDIVWKEWTTVGVNLKQYVGNNKKITARLTTFDCTWSGHCGYAYFTLSCSDGKFKDMKCGQINPNFKAPDGFKYRWMYAYNEKYRRADGSIPEKYVLSRGQNYEAGMHTDSLFVVDCMFVQDTSCYFSLYASTLATNPISVMKEPQIIKNCRDSIYKVKFDASDSWVQEIDHTQGNVERVSEAYHIESYEWNVEGLPYGWSDEVSPTFNFPSTGGDYRVTLRTSCGSCDSILVYDLHLDPLGPTHETHTYVLCDEVRKTTGFEWDLLPAKKHHEYGIVDSVILTASTTCDSIIYLELVEPYRIFEDTMVMTEGLPFDWHGRHYGEETKSMVDTVPFSETVCDTTYVLNIEVYEPLQAELLQSAFRDCEGADTLRLSYTISRGRSLRYSYQFDQPYMPDSLVQEVQRAGNYTIAIPLDTYLEPNTYTGLLHLTDSLPEYSKDFRFTLSIEYADSVIVQRWNDVLAIRNDSTIQAIYGADRGYDYVFDSVQWYYNGMPIEGATDFNYYTGQGTQLHLAGETPAPAEYYRALLTRTKDGAKVFTCEFIPQYVPEAAQPMPQLVQLEQTMLAPAATMRLRGKGTARWYDMLGRCHHTDLYNHSDITAPATAGFYILVLQEGNNRSTHRIMVR